MSITSIRKTRMPYKGGPGAVGIRYDPVDNQLKIHDGVRERIVMLSGFGTELKVAPFTVVLPADEGKTFRLALLAGINVTLPAVSAANKGHQLTFINTLLPTTNSYSLTPAAADRIGFLADAAVLENTEATDVLGDLITLESDGVDGWIIVNKIGIWAAA